MIYSRKIPAGSMSKRTSRILRVHFLKLATPGMSFFNRATIKLTKAHYDNDDNMSLTHRATSEQAEVFLSTHRNSSWDILRADPRVKRGT